MNNSGSITIKRRLAVKWEREDRTYDPDIKRIWLETNEAWDRVIELGHEEHRQLRFALDVAHEQVYGDQE